MAAATRERRKLRLPVIGISASPMRSPNCTVLSVQYHLRLGPAFKGAPSADRALRSRIIAIHSSGDVLGFLPLASPSPGIVFISALGYASLVSWYELGYERESFPLILNSRTRRECIMIVPFNCPALLRMLSTVWQEFYLRSMPDPEEIQTYPRPTDLRVQGWGNIWEMDGHPGQADHR